METPKLFIFLCIAYQTFASDHSHTIPVEDYETELQVLGQHVEIPETPVKVIKITKTVAVKIPVPYPVKVIEKVPYPVHVAKPYPVPVPQIVHVPRPAHAQTHGHEALDAGHGHQGGQGAQHYDGQSYQVQELHGNGQQSYLPSLENHHNSYNGDAGHGQTFGAAGNDDHSSEGSHFDGLANYGYSGDSDSQYSSVKQYHQKPLLNKKHHTG